MWHVYVRAWYWLFQFVLVLLFLPVMGSTTAVLASQSRNGWWLEQGGRRMNWRGEKTGFFVHSPKLCSVANARKLHLGFQCVLLVKISALSLLCRECALAVLRSLQKKPTASKWELCGTVSILCDYHTLWGEMEQFYKGLLISIPGQALQIGCERNSPGSFTA